MDEFVDMLLDVIEDMVVEIRDMFVDNDDVIIVFVGVVELIIILSLYTRDPRLAKIKIKPMFIMFIRLLILK